MCEHFDAFVLAQVHVEAFKNRACIAGGQVTDTHGERLFVLQDIRESAHGLFALDAVWDGVVERFASGIFFNADGIDIKRDLVEAYITNTG